MKYDKLYIASSSVDNVFASVAEKKLNKKVALVEQYGFLGGDITRALACGYTTKEIKSSVGLSLLFIQLKSQNHAFFLKNDDEVIFHPEYVKNALFDVVEKNEVEVLLHLKPVEVKATSAKVFGRDGMHTLTAKEIVYNVSQKKEYMINIFTTAVKNVQELEKFAHQIKITELPNGAFVSFKMKECDTEDVLTVFNQELSSFQKYCQAAGCMPMMLPCEPQAIK